MADAIFSGLKVIDCASWIAAPAAATILSDFGAEVIKLEPPGVGDPWRAWTPIPGRAKEYGWQVTARNKRSLAIDLKQPEGLAVLNRMIATTDVFITNFPLSVRDRLKIDHTHLLGLNPRLIYGSFTAYGEAGEEADRTGFDATAYWARTGLMDMVRADEMTDPQRSTPGMGDFPSGTGLFAAIVTALYRREKTGKGGLVQSSLVQNGLWANSCYVQTRLFGENVALRPPRANAPNALANHYRCKDGRWFLMALHNEQKQLAGFLKAIGRTELVQDERFATSDLRKKHAAALTVILDDVFAQKDYAEWREVLLGASVTFSGMHTVNEASSDPQFTASGALVPFSDGEHLTIASPFHIEGETKTAPRRAPSVGQHTEALLAEAGYSPADIAKLRAGGVLG